MQSPEHSHDGGAHEHLDEGLVQAWLDGQLSPDEARDVEARAAACAECAAIVAEARGLAAAASRILGALDPDAATPAMRDASLERTRALVRETPDAEAPRVEPAPVVVPIASARRRRRWAVPATIAATLLVGALSLLNDRERAGRSAFELKSAADESGAGAVATATSPSAAPMPIASPQAALPADSTTVSRRGFADRAGQPKRAEAVAGASRANAEPQRTMAPSEQLRVAETRAPAPAPSVAPPSAPTLQRAAVHADTVAARAAADQAIATARRDSAAAVRPVEESRQLRIDRREAAATRKAAASVVSGATANAFDAVAVTGANAAPRVPLCYVIERGAPELPRAVVLDTVVATSPGASAGRAYRVRSGSIAGQGAEVGTWSPLSADSILLAPSGGTASYRLGATPVGAVTRPATPDSMTLEIYRGTRSPRTATERPTAAAPRPTTAALRVRRVDCSR